MTIWAWADKEGFRELQGFGFIKLGGQVRGAGGEVHDKSEKWVTVPHSPCPGRFRLAEMLASQALKRLLPSGLLQAQAACGSRLGADAAFQVSGSERFHSDGEII